MAQLVWLITGCSSGLGQALALEVLSRGDLVIATARKILTLAPLASKGAEVLQLDVTSDQATLNELMNQAIAIYGRIDVLVNNAGYVLASSIEEVPAETLREQFETNAFGPMRVTTALLPHFRERRAGLNVFISSLNGSVAHAFTGPYAGSKFALEGMVESLWHETQPFGIQTLLIQPGRFRTLCLTEQNRRSNRSKIPDYIKATDEFFSVLDAQNQQQPGDINKGASIIVDLVRKEGVASGRTLPLRIPLGSDSYREPVQKAEELLRVIDEWKEVINSTDYAG